MAQKAFSVSNQLHGPFAKGIRIKAYHNPVWAVSHANGHFIAFFATVAFSEKVGQHTCFLMYLMQISVSLQENS